MTQPDKLIRNSQFAIRNYVLSHGFNPVPKLFALKGVSVAGRSPVLDPIVSIIDVGWELEIILLFSCQNLFSR